MESTSSESGSSSTYKLVCDSVVQPSNDARTYKYIKLNKNDLDILLIHDSKQEGKSAAAVNVKTGYLQDPLHRQGLAHFLEHMLFLGTEKYPEADFDAFLNENSGFSNAYTDYLETNYYYECSTSAFREGLDRFSSFFVSPLFNQDLVDREMNAVNSEHSNNLQDDNSRIGQLLDSSAIPSSPMTIFGTGNLETLKHESTRSDLLEFYAQNYSANLMKVCVITHEPLEEIEPYIVSLFENIPNKNKEAAKFSEKPFPNENFQALWKYVPIKNTSSIEVAWTSEYFTQSLYSKHPLSYWTHLFGFEGENSLLSALKQLGFAEGLSSGYTDIMENSSVIYIHIDLTNEGLANYMQVLDVVFAYIKVLKELGPQQYVFDEERTAGIQQFNSLDQEDALDYAHRLTANMQVFKPNHVIKALYYTEEYDADLLKKTLDGLTTDNMRVFMASQTFEAECTQTEKYYGSKYLKASLPEEIIALFNNTKYTVENGKKPIGFPPKNPFISSDLSLVEIGEDEEQQKYPRVIKADEKSTVYFKQDTQFKVPKTIVNVIVHSNDQNTRVNCENYLLSLLWNKLFEESAREFVYQAEMAKIYTRLSFKATTEIMVEGFSASVAKYVTEYIRRLFNFNPSGMADEFKVQLSKLQKKMHNFSKKQPYEQAKFWNTLALKWQGVFSRAEMEATVDVLTFDKLVQFHEGWLKNIHLNWFVAGNIRVETASKLIEEWESIIFTNRQPLDKALIYVPVSVSLSSSDESDFIFESALDQDEKNSYISSTFQFDHISPLNDVLAKLIETFLEEPFYSSLRTEQQLGYIVWTTQFAERTMLFIRFQVQSDCKPPQYLAGQIEEFICKLLLEK